MNRSRAPSGHVVICQSFEAFVAVLSVVMPNFNHGHLIGHALDALAAQERTPDEIIVIDDASTDDSLAVLERYRESLPQLIVLRSERTGGAIPASQRGLEAATGRFVYFAAADDWVLPGFFSTALGIIEADPDCGFVCGEAMLLNGETGERIGYRPAVRPRMRGGKFSPEMTRRLLARTDNFMLAGSAIFQRAHVMAKGGFDARAGSFADGLLTRKVALTHGFHFVPAVFAVWNVFSQGYSRTTALEVERARKALNELPALMERDADFPPWYAAVFRRRWRFGAARLALESTPPRVGVLLEMGALAVWDKWFLSLLAPFVAYRPARWLALAYLTIRLKPYRLRDIIATAIARRRTLPA
jgi:glycosyltransferase involved in cell wall biosynthesis